MTLRITYDRPVLRAGNDVAAEVFGILDRAQIEYLIKARVQDVITSTSPLPVRLSYLQAIRLSRDLESSICEILLADADERGGRRLTSCTRTQRRRDRRRRPRSPTRA